MHARYEIMQENYAKTIRIEAMTTSDMIRKDILPAVSAYGGMLAKTLAAKRGLDEGVDVSYELGSLKRLSELTAMTGRTVDQLDQYLMDSASIGGCEELSNFCRDKIFAAMSELRIYVDEMETITSAKYWPYPTYGEMLFSVR